MSTSIKKIYTSNLNALVENLKKQLEEQNKTADTYKSEVIIYAEGVLDELLYNPATAPRVLDYGTWTIDSAGVKSGFVGLEVEYTDENDDIQSLEVYALCFEDDQERQF